MENSAKTSSPSTCIDGSSAHHWMLPTPNGATEVTGYWKRCESVRSFPVTIETGAWEGQQPTGQARRFLPIGKVNNF